MRRFTKTVATLLLAGAWVAAQAQPTYLPVSDLIDVPTSLATPKAVSAVQLRGAIVSAALAGQWDVEPQEDGVLLLTYFKDLNYRIVLRATFTETTYSLRYVRSENMREAKMPIIPGRAGVESSEEYTARWRSTRSNRSPERGYSVDRKDLTIHPEFEVLLYELSAGVRRHLRLL